MQTAARCPGAVKDYNAVIGILLPGLELGNCRWPGPRLTDKMNRLAIPLQLAVCFRQNPVHPLRYHKESRSASGSVAVQLVRVVEVHSMEVASPVTKIGSKDSGQGLDTMIRFAVLRSKGKYGQIF